MSVVTLSADKSGEFKILLVADLHTDISEEANKQTWNDIRSLIAKTSPDLLVLLGDVWCADDKPERGPEFMKRDIAVLENVQVPWAFVWGNHDFGLDTTWANEMLVNAKHSVMPSDHANGNYRIEIRECDSKRVAWDIFCLNSHNWSLQPSDLDWFVTTSQSLAQTRGELIPAIVFFHIPLKQYEWARLEHSYTGEACEQVGYWGNEENIIAPFLRTNNVKAIFVGHSHANDFHFQKHGIIFSYARATGYAGYGEDELLKGAKLIILQTTSKNLDFFTVFAGEP